MRSTPRRIASEKKRKREGDIDLFVIVSTCSVDTPRVCRGGLLFSNCVRLRDCCLFILDETALCVYWQVNGESQLAESRNVADGFKCRMCPKKYEINLIVKLAARKEQRQTAPFDVSGIRRCALLLISAREHLSAFRETNTPTDCIRKTS